MYEIDCTQVPKWSYRKIVFGFQWKSWIISFSWQIPSFLDIALDEYFIYDYIPKPDPATYPLFYQPRVPSYYENDF